LIKATGLLRIFAVLFCLLALSNLLKPLQLTSNVGFVFLGHRLGGTANTILGPTFGIYLAVYAYSIFTMRSFALPMGIGYALYVVANLILWNLGHPAESEGSRRFGLAYMAVAIGVSSGAAYLLAMRRDSLD